MRASVLFLLLAALVACNRGAPNEAIRQGVIDHLAKKGLNVQGMDVALNSVQRNGPDADAAVTISPKGGNAAQGMSFKYHLQQRDNAWVVVGASESGSPHGGMAAPAGENPHGAAPSAPGGSEKMPDPSALPPSSPKK